MKRGRRGPTGTTSYEDAFQGYLLCLKPIRSHKIVFEEQRENTAPEDQRINEHTHASLFQDRHTA